MTQVLLNTVIAWENNAAILTSGKDVQNQGKEELILLRFLRPVTYLALIAASPLIGSVLLVDYHCHFSVPQELPTSWLAPCSAELHFSD